MSDIDLALRRLTASIESRQKRHALQLFQNALIVSVPNPRVRLPEKDLQTRGEYHITILDPDEIGDFVRRKGWDDAKLRNELEEMHIDGDPEYVCLGKQEKGDNA